MAWQIGLASNGRVKNKMGKEKYGRLENIIILRVTLFEVCMQGRLVSISPKSKMTFLVLVWTSPLNLSIHSYYYNTH